MAGLMLPSQSTEAGIEGLKAPIFSSPATFFTKAFRRKKVSRTPELAGPQAQNNELLNGESVTPVAKIRSPFEPTNQKLLTEPKKILQLEYKAQLPDINAIRSPNHKWQFDVMNPGPLTRESANNFLGAKYSEGIVPDGKTLKLWKAGDANVQGGTWFSIEPPRSKTLVHIDGAVKPVWVSPKTGFWEGNSELNAIYSIELHPGDKFYYGPTGEQGGVHLGGQDRIQVYVPIASKRYIFKNEGPLP